jgi:hypothetical protein
MPDIPRDLGVLAKQIADYRVENASDLKHLTEMLRALFMDTADLADIAEYEIRAALGSFDGNTKRAKQVTRPLRHAQTLVALAARRAVNVWRQYLKVYGEEARNTRRGGRRFDPKK